MGGVHMMLEGRPLAPWRDDEKKETVIVIIGRNLDVAALSVQFHRWFGQTPRQRKAGNKDSKSVNQNDANKDDKGVQNNTKKTREGGKSNNEKDSEGGKSRVDDGSIEELD